MAEIGVMKKLTIGGKTYTIPEYSLPIASASTLGGVRVGTGLVIESGTGILSATGTDVTIDSEMSSSSTNPVQNQVVKAYVDQYKGTVTSITLTQGTGIIVSNSGTAITTSGSRTISLASITKSDTTSTASPSHGGTFTAIDSITYDTYGRVTGVNTKTITLPADSNTDTKVTQAYSTTNNSYPVLFSATAGVSSTSSRGATTAILNNAIYANPSTGDLHVTKLNGVAVGTSPKFTDTTYTNVSEFTNDAGYITSADVPEGASAYTGTISAVGTTASNGTSNGFARGDHVHNITSSTITSALGYTPYNSTNPNGYITASHTSTYSLPLAASGTRGGVQIGYSESGKNYAVKLSSEKMYVNVPWTDTQLTLGAVTSGTTYYPIVGTGTTAATRQYDTTGFVYKGTNGTTSAVGSAQLTIGNSTASGTANNKQGQLIIYGSTAYAHTISGAPTANRTLTLPNATGTIALTSDIPSVPTTATNSTTGISIADHSTTSVGSASNWSAGTASTWAFEDIACDDITAWSAGSGSYSATVTNHVLSFSHGHTAPSLSYTARTVSSKKSGSNSTVPSLTVTSTTVVNGKSHTITDNGHTHSLS